MWLKSNESVSLEFRKSRPTLIGFINQKKRSLGFVLNVMGTMGDF